MFTRTRWSLLASVAVVAIVGGGIASTGCVSDDPTVKADTTAGTKVGGCPEYCDALSRSCPPGPTAQFASKDDCNRICPFLSSDTNSIARDGENTVQCRVQAATKATSKETCMSAGILGGNGTCGSACQGFCDLVINNCKDAPVPPYSGDVATCTEQCNANLAAKFDATKGATAEADATDTLNCRAYHAILSTFPNAKPTHCPHTEVVSAVCK